jgi:3-deoxy-D-manno-octulosonic acid kinase
VSERAALGPEVKRIASAGGVMLYDSSRAGNLTAEWFDARYWANRSEIEGHAQGRGAVWFIKSAEGRRYVLRHYRRGGLLGRLRGDRYGWHDEDSTRAFREWQLTYRLHRAGLPVPAPVGARYQRDGGSYRADLLTERLPTVGTLAECLRTGALSVTTWIAIGRCIQRFHDVQLWHADLNAHNVLLSEEDIYLVDFDRSRLRPPGLWRDGNLVRLRRSLEKVTWGLPPDRFSEADWFGLLDGYRQSSVKSEPLPV